MRVVVCAMAKNEHKYINEWIKHYIDLGFSKLYIYDNDDIDSPNIKDTINTEYLDKVKIKNIRGQHSSRLQQRIYTGFYYKYSHNFDWVFFCDIDEFLVGTHDIRAFLKKTRFQNAKQIRVKWKLFGDDDLIERDMNLGVKETFHNEITHSLNRNLVDIGTLENQGKMFVRGGLYNVIITSPHFASYVQRDNIIPSVLPSGRECKSKVVIEEDYSNEKVFLNHYIKNTIKRRYYTRYNYTFNC